MSRSTSTWRWRRSRGEALERRPAALLRGAECRRHGVRHQVRVGEGVAGTKATPAGKRAHPVRHLQREPGLARPAGAGQRHQPGAFEQPFDRHDRRGRAR